MKRRNVRVTAFWGSDDVAATVSLRRSVWSRIQRGETYEATSTYYYEGERFTAEWEFNANGPGTLVVGYDGGGVGFDGKIEHCVVDEGGE